MKIKYKLKNLFSGNSSFFHSILLKTQLKPKYFYYI